MNEAAESTRRAKLSGDQDELANAVLDLARTVVAVRAYAAQITAQEILRYEPIGGPGPVLRDLAAHQGMARDTALQVSETTVGALQDLLQGALGLGTRFGEELAALDPLLARLPESREARDDALGRLAELETDAARQEDAIELGFRRIQRQIDLSRTDRQRLSGDLEAARRELAGGTGDVDSTLGAIDDVRGRIAVELSALVRAAIEEKGQGASIVVGRLIYTGARGAEVLVALGAQAGNDAGVAERVSRLIAADQRLAELYLALLRLAPTLSFVKAVEGQVVFLTDALGDLDRVYECTFRPTRDIRSLSDSLRQQVAAVSTPDEARNLQYDVDSLRYRFQLNFEMVPPRLLDRVAELVPGEVASVIP